MQTSSLPTQASDGRKEKAMKELYEDMEYLLEVTGHSIGDAVDKIRAAGGKLSPGDDAVVDHLTHTVKSALTSLAMMGADGSYDDGMDRSYGDYRSNRSYARKRDSMGRYSRRMYDGDMR